MVPVFAAVTFATNFSLPSAGMPVLFRQISQDLNLSVVQIGSVWGTISIGSILVVPMGGLLCDRIGNKRAIVIIGLLGGITGALRGAANSFLSLMATTFLWGLISAAIIPAINMISSTRISQDKQGLAQGLIAAGGALGLTLGSLTAPPCCLLYWAAGETSFSCTVGSPSSSASSGGSVSKNPGAARPLKSRPTPSPAPFPTCSVSGPSGLSDSP